MVLDLTTILIIGANGQDGSILTELLDAQENRLILSYNKKLNPTLEKISGKNSRIQMDIRSKVQVIDVIRKFEPEIIYNLSSPGGVGYSYENPRESFDVNCVGAMNILDAIMSLKMQEDVYLFQASSGEVFGEVRGAAHTESSAINPVSPYGTAKAASLMLCNTYRRIYGVKIGVGIMFNHESERREINYVTRKIISGLVRWSLGHKERIQLGNIDIVRDWILAKDAMSAATLIANKKLSDNYIVARGEGHSIRQFIRTSLSVLKIDEDFDTVISSNPKFIRPNEILNTYGDPRKLHKETLWKPSSSFEAMISYLIKKELENQR